jgi:hypothetical protein
LSEIKIIKCSTKSEIIAYFNANDYTQGNAVVTISIEDLPILKFDVELYGIPYDPEIGHEVTVNFYAPTVNN